MFNRLDLGKAGAATGEREISAAANRAKVELDEYRAARFRCQAVSADFFRVGESWRESNFLD